MAPEIRDLCAANVLKIGADAAASVCFNSEAVPQNVPPIHLNLVNMAKSMELGVIRNELMPSSY